jgi:hypothetical protein
MANIFGDNPPADYRRGNKGWLKAKSSPQKVQVKELKQENKDLKSRLELLEAAVAELASKKKK